LRDKGIPADQKRQHWNEICEDQLKQRQRADTRSDDPNRKRHKYRRSRGEERSRGHFENTNRLALQEGISKNSASHLRGAVMKRCEHGTHSPERIRYLAASTGSGQYSTPGSESPTRQCRSG